MSIKEISLLNKTSWSDGGNCSRGPISGIIFLETIVNNKVKKFSVFGHDIGSGGRVDGRHLKAGTTKKFPHLGIKVIAD